MALTRPQRSWYERVYLKSVTWITTRNNYLRKVAFTCEDCHCRPACEVHHLSYDNLGSELDSDLMALCLNCHANKHPKKRRYNQLKAVNDNQFQLPFMP